MWSERFLPQWWRKAKPDPWPTSSPSPAPSGAYGLFQFAPAGNHPDQEWRERMAAAEEERERLIREDRIKDHTPAVPREQGLGAKTPAEMLCAAIEAHRDARYHDGPVTNLLDGRLYDAATWFRSWQDHAADPDAPIPDDA